MARRPATAAWFHGLLAGTLLAASLLLPGDMWAEPRFRAHAAAPIQGEEVAASGAAAWHEAGIDGALAKIAVIAGSFSGYQERVAAGELPRSIRVLDWTGGNYLQGMGAGTAAAEVIHEMAPSAEIYLLAVEDLAGLQQAKDYCKENRIGIVCNTTNWFNTSRGDGSGGPGTPDATVADARASGILWINSAGDHAGHHWAGAFADADGDGLHEFVASGPDPEQNRFSLPAGASVSVYLKWDAWPSTSQDLDLYLYALGNEAPLAHSTTEQLNTPPVEALTYTNATATEQTCYVSIRRKSGPAPVRLDLFVLGAQPAHSVPAGSIPEPASSPHALAAGAVHWQTSAPDPIASRGPTVDGGIKPDMAGLSGMVTATLPGGFFGTQAGAASVAGAAALVKQRFPLYGPAEIQSFLESFALEMGEPGRDNLYGAGVLRLPVPVPAPAVQSIDLHAGWNWFSLAVQPPDPALSVVLSSIASSYDYVLGEEGTCSPTGEPHLNTLTTIEPGRAYMIRMKEAATLTVGGARVPPNTAIDLTDGWHWVGYLGMEPASPADALSSVNQKYDWVLGETGTFAPPPAPAHLNNLPIMEQGKGYLIHMNQPGTIVYEP